MNSNILFVLISGLANSSDSVFCFLGLVNTLGLFWGGVIIHLACFSGPAQQSVVFSSGPANSPAFFFGDDVFLS